MKLEQTTISDLQIFKPKINEDNRGYFLESFKSTMTLSITDGSPKLAKDLIAFILI